MSLTDAAIKGAKAKEKPYRMSDGRGLYLLIKPSSAKLWRLDYRLHGKRRTYAIGQYPDISLRQVRNLSHEAKMLIADGIDPVRHRKDARTRQRNAFENTFGRVAREWFELKSEGWSEGHAKAIDSRLRINLLPELGDRPLIEIEPPELLMVLRKIEAKGAIDAAHRCRTIASAVFAYGIQTGRCVRNPASDLTGALRPRKPAKFAAITDPVKVGGLMRAIRSLDGVIIRNAMLFQALTAVRPGELRKAEWSEITWPRAEWRIPAEKMKMGREHVVPLSRQAIAVLQEIHKVTGSGRYIFPELQTLTRPMGGSTINSALRRLGYGSDEMCSHGFRSTFSTLLHEAGFDHDIIELQLSHQRRDQVAAAYDRSQRLSERRKMMQWYANYLDKLEQEKKDERAEGHGE